MTTSPRRSVNGPMSRRLTLSLALAAALACVAISSAGNTWDVLIYVTVAGGMLALAGLCLWFLRALGTREDLVRRANLERFREATPADGEVTVARMASVRSETLGQELPWKRFVAEEPMEELVPARLESRNPPLLGRVAVVSIFLGRHEVGWSETEIAQAMEAVESAGIWIEQEAARMSAPINIDLADVVFVHTETVEDDVEVVMASESSRLGLWDRDSAVKHLASVSRAARAAGFADGADLLSRINPRLSADAVVWILHHRCAGRSLAIPAAWAELPGVGIAVLYSRYANLPEPLGPDEEPWSDPLTLAHELLHLFGATDKYGRPLSDYPAGTVSNRDIMRLGARTLTQHEVGPLTAYEIGWVTEPIRQARPSKRKSPGVSGRKRGRAY